MRNLDFSSWQGLLSTFFGLAVITLIGVGIRLLAMQTIQQRRERENRQINERQGRPTHTAELVVSLRDFIRSVLDLDAIPASVVIPKQGPTRPSSGLGGKSRAEAGKSEGREGGGGKSGGGGMGSGGAMGGGMAGGAAAGVGVGLSADDEHNHHP
jgi:uncharacterized membrane protein YgcG